jgi:hypothetical protein
MNDPHLTISDDLKQLSLSVAQLTEQVERVRHQLKSHIRDEATRLLECWTHTRLVVYGVKSLHVTPGRLHLGLEDRLTIVRPVHYMAVFDLSIPNTIRLLSQTMIDSDGARFDASQIPSDLLAFFTTVSSVLTPTNIEQLSVLSDWLTN